MWRVIDWQVAREIIYTVATVRLSVSFDIYYFIFIFVCAPSCRVVYRDFFLCRILWLLFIGSGTVGS